MNDIDITNQIRWHDIDSESLSLAKCACGKEFDYWDFILNIYPDMARECLNCHRKLYFKFSIQVFEKKQT